MDGLTFADPSLMVDLAMVARRLNRYGRALRVRGAAPQIRVLIELVGLNRLSGVSLEPTTTPAVHAVADARRA